MKLLSIDTSSISASAALYENEKLIGEFFINTSLTHSQTIMPMIENLLKAVDTSIKDIDLFAVATGPGSFTGLRIGISAVKGMAHALDKPCLAVSTLEGLAYNLADVQGIICPVMDARCSQVYTAIFKCENGLITRLEQDTAMSVDELAEKLKLFSQDIFLVGDGALLCYNSFGGGNVKTASKALLYGRASSIGAVAYRDFLLGKAIMARELLPQYIRLPQAQRILNSKNALK